MSHGSLMILLLTAFVSWRRFFSKEAYNVLNFLRLVMERKSADGQ